MACELAKVGITPARAGNSFEQSGRKILCQDHPRACGEQGSRGNLKPEQRGSPPRVRGTVNFELIHKPAVRITPARAGNRQFPTGKEHQE